METLGRTPKHVALLLALLLLGISIISTAYSAEQEPAPQQEWSDAAIKLERASDWASLVRHATAWIESRPEEKFAWYALFIAQVRQGDFSAATSTVSRSISTQNELVDFWMTLSDRAIEGREHDSAISISRGVLDAVNLAPAWKNLGYAQMRSGLYIEAARSLQEYVEQDPDDKLSFLYLGLIYDNSRQHASAIEHFQRALKIDPAFASAWYQLGHTYYKLDGNNIRAEGAHNALKALDAERATQLASLIRLGDARASTQPQAMAGNARELTESDLDSRASSQQRGVGVSRSESNQPLFVSDRSQEPDGQCRFNSDCPGLQKCHKPSGSSTGFCGVLVDEVGMREPDAERAAQCSFNTDCGVGFTCRKQLGKITGICTR